MVVLDTLGDYKMELINASLIGTELHALKLAIKMHPVVIKSFRRICQPKEESYIGWATMMVRANEMVCPQILR